jgi:hypothetical protein
LRDKGTNASIRSRSLPLTKKLNEIWRQDAPLNLEVSSSGANSARIVQDGDELVEVLPQDAAGQDALEVAQAWAEAIERVVHNRKPQGKLPVNAQYDRTNPTGVRPPP